ncbi:MAG: DUF4442 domain-containing protein [Nitriliruptorales bacterium]|nr:DUF4442 domain-containing protein [Nitriliruptorales bacterium]
MTDTTGFERSLDFSHGDDLGRLFRDAIRQMPFTAYMDVGVRNVSPGEAEIELPEDERFTNHVGTVHAIAELVPAETAGGAAIVSELSDLIEAGYVPIAKALRVSWTAPARGTLTARARLLDEQAGSMRAAAERGEQVACTLPITVTDPDGTTVAEVEVDYVLKDLG